MLFCSCSDSRMGATSRLKSLAPEMMLETMRRRACWRGRSRSLASEWAGSAEVELKELDHHNDDKAISPLNFFQRIDAPCTWVHHARRRGGNGRICAALTASRITTDISHTASTFICPTCLHAHKTRPTAPCLAVAPGRHADRRYNRRRHSGRSSLARPRRRR